jgi:hypothetical protein
VAISLDSSLLPTSQNTNGYWTDDINKMTKTDWKKYTRQSYELVKQKLPAKIKKQIDESNLL